MGIELLHDINWWARFLYKFNGIVMMPFQDWTEPDSIIAVDACGTGLGGICWKSGEVFHLNLPESYTCFHINELEMLCLVLALKIWGSHLKKKKILVFSDNMVTVTVVNSGRSHSSYLQACLREIAYIMCTNESEIRTIHVPGHSNRIPDYLSRWYTNGKFQALFWNEILLRNMLHEIKELTVPIDLLEIKNNW
jgi:hypothetical protein